jgi:aryl-alcohol dehydrogenase-like predicted oxidoreductase
MQCRRFGNTGLRVSELFLGAMTFGEQGGVGAPIEECRRIVDAYFEAGGNVIDTAINYRGGASEEIVGELLVGRRDRFVLATKYTVSRDRGDPNGAGNHRKNLRLSLDTSLRQLQTDYLDIYWVHMWDRHTPIEETMRALDDEVRAGRILYVGISDTPAWIVSEANTLAQWRDWTAFAGLQVPYSLLQRDIERDLLPMAESLGMTVAAWRIHSRRGTRIGNSDRSVIDNRAPAPAGHNRPVRRRRTWSHTFTGSHSMGTYKIAQNPSNYRRTPARPASRQPRRCGHRTSKRCRCTAQCRNGD